MTNTRALIVGVIALWCGIAASVALARLTMGPLADIWASLEVPGKPRQLVAFALMLAWWCAIYLAVQWVMRRTMRIDNLVLYCNEIFERWRKEQQR